MSTKDKLQIRQKRVYQRNQVLTFKNYSSGMGLTKRLSSKEMFQKGTRQRLEEGKF